MPAAEAADYRFNPFDLTKVWPHEDYPPIEIGRLELNRNPENIFAEVEQSVFSPHHFVPGIGPSPDKMLQGRLFAYGDAHRYRVGINADHLPVNRPHATEARTNGRDGFLYDGRHGGRARTTSRTASAARSRPDRPLWQPIAVTGATGNHAAPSHAEDDDFVQAGNLYRLMSEDEKEPPDREPRGLHRQGLPRRHRRAGDRQLPPGGRRLRQAAGGRGPGPARLTGACRRARAGSLPVGSGPPCALARSAAFSPGRGQASAGCWRRGPAADDVAYGDDADRFVARRARSDGGSRRAPWRPGRLLQGPGRRGEDDVGGGVGAGRSPWSGSWPAPRELRMSRSVRMPMPPASVSRTTAAPTRRAAISAGGLTEGVCGADGEDHRAHGVTDEHGVEPPPW